MANITDTQDTRYYKSMRLKSESLVVEVKEKADYSYTDNDGNRIEQLEPPHVNIFHSPQKFDLKPGTIKLTSRASLKEYIDMLQQFESKYGDLLDMVQAKEGK